MKKFAGKLLCWFGFHAYTTETKRVRHSMGARYYTKKGRCGRCGKWLWLDPWHLGGPIAKRSTIYDMEGKAIYEMVSWNYNLH